MPLLLRVLMVSWAALSKPCLQVKGVGNSALFSTGEATPGVLGPVIHYPVQERPGHSGENPTEGYKDGKRTGEPLL